MKQNVHYIVTYKSYQKCVNTAADTRLNSQAHTKYTGRFIGSINMETVTFWVAIL